MNIFIHCCTDTDDVDGKKGRDVGDFSVKRGYFGIKFWLVLSTHQKLRRNGGSCLLDQKHWQKKAYIMKIIGKCLFIPDLDNANG